MLELLEALLMDVELRVQLFKKPYLFAQCKGHIFVHGFRDAGISVSGQWCVLEAATYIIF